MIEDAVDYSKRYLRLETTNYRKVCYNLHVCPDCSHWPNVLLLCGLAFSLPFSNSRADCFVIESTQNLKQDQFENKYVLWTILRFLWKDLLLTAFLQIKLLNCGGMTAAPLGGSIKALENHISQERRTPMLQVLLQCLNSS